jgi:uncharacterized protein YjfI (DUF2170 family)
MNEYQNRANYDYQQLLNNQKMQAANQSGWMSLGGNIAGNVLGGLAQNGSLASGLGTAAKWLGNTTGITKLLGSFFG